MADDPLLEQLLAQQAGRQGHPLRAVASESLSPMGFIRQLLGEDAPADQQATAAQQLKLGQLPSEVVGNVQGRRGDIDLPASLSALQSAKGSR